MISSILDCHNTLIGKVNLEATLTITGEIEKSETAACSHHGG